MFHLPDETKPDIYFQFKYSCDKTIVGKHEEEFGAIQPIQRGISQQMKTRMTMDAQTATQIRAEMDSFFYNC